jgi:DNA-binding MarR family transcriptional regulator
MTRQREVILGWLGLLGAVEKLKKTIDARLRDRFSVSISGFDVMAALDRAGAEGLRAGALTQKLRVTDGATSQVASTLERAGFVERRRDKADGRAVVFVLTPTGRKTFKEMAAAHHGWVTEFFEPLSDLDIESLRGLMGQINSSGIGPDTTRQLQ